MADEARTPVAIRITRPYGSEDEFLEREIDTLTRTSIVLLGAQQRPQGVVLRFELALATGAPLVRGEGRVVAFKERAFEDLPGLTLRFTRLDARSKALIDRAAAMRDATRSRPPPPMAKAPPPARPPSAPPPARPPSAPPPRASVRPPIAPTPLRVPSIPPPPDSGSIDVDLEATRAEAPSAKRSDRPPPPAQPPPLPPRARTAPPPLPRAATSAPVPVAPPAAALDLEATRAEAPRPKRASERPPPSRDRDAALARLRERRRSLDDDAVRALLAKKR